MQISFFLAPKKKLSILLTDDDREGSVQAESPFFGKLFSLEKDLLRTLAEVRFINAEVSKLFSC